MAESLPCQKIDIETTLREKFSWYVCLNEYGGVRMRVRAELIRAWLVRYETLNELALGCWELRENEHNPMHIDIRLTPSMELDQRDNLWHSWNYTFMPESDIV